MNYLKKLGISFIYIMTSLVILTFIITFLNYIGLISGKIFNFSKIFIAIISMFIGGFKFGKSSKSKGWLEGLKLSIIFTLLLIIFNYLILGNKFDIKNILFYSILIISCIFGSMLGISFKRENK